MVKEFTVDKKVFPQTAAAFASEAGTEIVRKSIHFLIALCPGMVAINRPVTLFLLTAGVAGYTVMEQLRLSGVKVPVVSSITRMASRPRDEGSFVMGPVTLGLGALLTLLFFSPAAATVGIYTLAFGDGFASLVGKLFGRHRPAFLQGKSIEGSFACFAAVFISSLFVCHSYPAALTVAFTAAAVEALPLEDYDNIALPLIGAAVVQLFLY